MTPSSSSYVLHRADCRTRILDVLHVAASVWTRFMGLQFRRSLPPSHGLLLVPCSAIHTMFMRFAIDVFFLSDEGTVMEIRRNVMPWRIVVPDRTAHAVLEVAAGTLDVETGERLAIDPGKRTIRPRLQFLVADSAADCVEDSE